MSRALIPLADGFEDIEAVSVIDVLRRGGVEVVTASLGDSQEVRSAHGIMMRAEVPLMAVLDDLFDAVVLPGGGEGTENLKRDPRVAEILRRHQGAKRLVAAICAAPVILTELGIVPENVPMVCYPTCIVDLGRPCANAPVVADENFITGQAPGSALLFALVVLQYLEGEAMARKVSRGLVTDVL